MGGRGEQSQGRSLVGAETWAGFWGTEKSLKYGDGGEERREEGRLSRQWECLEQRGGCVQGLWGFSVAGDTACIWAASSLSLAVTKGRFENSLVGVGLGISGARASIWLCAQGSWRESLARRTDWFSSQSTEATCPSQEAWALLVSGRIPHTAEWPFCPGTLHQKIWILQLFGPLSKGLANSYHWAFPGQGPICLQITYTISNYHKDLEALKHHVLSNALKSDGLFSNQC